MPVCLYCGMERGIVPLIEIEPGMDISEMPWLPDWEWLDLCGIGVRHDGRGRRLP